MTVPDEWAPDAEKRPATTEVLKNGTAATADTRPSSDEAPALARGTLVGRYMVLEPIGAGGMGQVYLALDPYLERRVAIKLVRDRAPDGQARLLREAQAMARLADPHVVTVHDVGVVGDQVFLAMEFIDGGTVRHWLDERPRTWCEIARVFLAAGRGLASAHAVGIVHRDFKPDNIIMGKDGRIRVTDFGLARHQAPEAHEPHDAEDGSSTTDLPTSSSDRGPITRAGAVAGTPGYVAPEQLAGKGFDARADQYSFCVALHVALFGVLPGAAPAAAAQPGSFVRAAVPARLRRLIVRGLDPDPARRFSDMDALLRVLDVDRSNRRRYVAWTLTAGAMFAAAYVIQQPRGSGTAQPAEARMCQGAEDRLVGVWDEPVREQVSEAFAATSVPYAMTTLMATRATLDEYAQGWAAMHTDACQATRIRGEQSDEVLTLRMGCLDRRLAELRALTQRLSSADRSVVDRASQAAATLAPLAACADVEQLRRPRRPTGPPERLDAITAQLAEARAAWMLGNPKGVVAAEAAVAGARQIGARGYEAEGLMLQGFLEVAAGKFAESRVSLSDAAFGAAAVGNDELAVSSAIRLALVLGYSLGKPEDGAYWMRLADALSERLGRPPALEVDRLGAAGIFASRGGNPAEAVRYHQQAVELGARTYGADALVQWKRHADLGGSYFESGESRLAIEQFERALDIKRAYQGEEHPDNAMLLSNLAAAHSRLGENIRALSLLERALAIRERVVGPESALLIVPLNNLASTLTDVGRATDAIPVVRRAIAIAESKLGPDNLQIVYAQTTLGGALTASDKLAEAEDVLIATLARAERVGGVDHVIVASVLETTIELRRRQRRDHEALVLAQRAIALRERVQGAAAADLVPPLVAAAKAQLALGRTAPARAMLERAKALCESGRAAAPACADAERSMAGLTVVAREQAP